METIFMNLENSKMNQPHKFFLKLLQRWNSNKFVALKRLSIYKHVKKNIKKTTAIEQ